MVKKICIVWSRFTEEIIINDSGRPYREDHSIVIKYNGNIESTISKITEALGKYKKRKCLIELCHMEKNLEALICRTINENFSKFKIRKQRTYKI